VGLRISESDPISCESMCGDVAKDEEELSPSSIAKKITVTKVRFIRSRDSLVEMVVGVGRRLRKCY
jgi:hypothetical protein